MVHTAVVRAFVVAMVRASVRLVALFVVGLGTVCHVPVVHAGVFPGFGAASTGPVVLLAVPRVTRVAVPFASAFVVVHSLVVGVILPPVAAIRGSFFIAPRGLTRDEIHPALGARAGPIPDDLGVHRTGILSPALERGGLEALGLRIEGPLREQTAQFRHAGVEGLLVGLHGDVRPGKMRNVFRSCREHRPWAGHLGVGDGRRLSQRFR